MDLMGDANVAPAKKSRLAQRDQKEAINNVKLMELLAKLCLANSLQTRLLRAIVIDCFRVKTDNKYIVAHKEATIHFAETAKSLKENESLSPEEIKERIGIPSVHGFNAMLKAMIQDKVPGYEKLTEAVALWKSQQGWRTIHMHIRHCRVAKMYKSEFKRLEVSCPLEQNCQAGAAPATVDGLTPTWAWVQMKAVILKTDGFMTLEGIAPAGDMERRVQEYLDSMK